MRHGLVVVVDLGEMQYSMCSSYYADEESMGARLAEKIGE